MYKQKCNLLVCIITILSILYIILTLIIIDNMIGPIEELMFFKQFFILSILYIIILPIIMIIISNLYFLITSNKDWFSWLKISESFNDVFTIIALFPFVFIMYEISIFFGYYTQLFEINKIFIVIIFGIIGGLLFIGAQILIRIIFKTY